MVNPWAYNSAACKRLYDTTLDMITQVRAWGLTAHVYNTLAHAWKSDIGIMMVGVDPFEARRLPPPQLHHCASGCSVLYAGHVAGTIAYLVSLR